MKSFHEPFINEKYQFVFCSLGLFWVSNANALLTGNSFLNDLLVYPVYLALVPVFLYLILCIKKIREELNSIAFYTLCLLVLLAVILILAESIHSPRGTMRKLLVTRTDAVIVWLMPLALIYGLKKQFWLTWIPQLRSVVIIGMIYIFLIAVLGIVTKASLQRNIYNSSDFLFLSAFLIIFSTYKPNTLNSILGILGVIVLVSNMFMANERYAIAYIGLMCIFYMVHIVFEYHRANMKILLFYAATILILLSLFIVTKSPSFQRQIYRNFVLGELWEDTRGGGELGKSATRRMSPAEKLFGKGVNGTYIYGYRGWPPQLYIRSNVEIGYKQIIFKKGYLTLAGFLILSLTGVYLGLFKSNNKVTKYLSYIIIARLILMVTAMIPRVGFEYFMYWIVVGGCLSSQLRSLDDTTLKEDCIKKGSIVFKW